MHRRSGSYDIAVRPDVVPFTSTPRPVSVIVQATGPEYTPRLEKCLASFEATETVETVLVWLSHDPPPFPAVVAEPDEVFCLSRARNIGARHASHDLLVFIDADILVGDVLDRAVAASRPGRFVTCLTTALDEAGRADHVIQRGFGGFLAVARSDFEQICGYDEGYRGWGCEDNDFVDRLVVMGLEHYNLSEQEGVTVQHQWHPRKDGVQHSLAAIRNRHRYETLVTPFRNPGEWGSLQAHRPRRSTSS